MRSGYSSCHVSRHVSRYFPAICRLLSALCLRAARRRGACRQDRRDRAVRGRGAAAGLRRVTRDQGGRGRGERERRTRAATRCWWWRSTTTCTGPPRPRRRRRWRWILRCWRSWGRGRRRQPPLRRRSWLRRGCRCSPRLTRPSRRRARSGGTQRWLTLRRSPGMARAAGRWRPTSGARPADARGVREALRSDTFKTTQRLTIYTTEARRSRRSKKSSCPRWRLS